MEFTVKVSYFSGALSLIALMLGTNMALAAEVPVNLSTWTQESYPAVDGFGAGNWTVSGDGNSVYQSVNGQPTMFYSDFNSYGSQFTGTINVASGAGDDDYIGFALGFNPGDTSNSSADYLLIDWKRNRQSWDFKAPSTTPGSLASAGLAVSRVTGTPTADELWGHTDFDSHTGGGVQQLQRGTTLGSTGWEHGVDYAFNFDFGPEKLDVFVDGVLALSIEGVFNDGRFGFYNFSQHQVTYSGFERSTPVPVPAAVWLFSSALIGMVGFVKRGKAA